MSLKQNNEDITREEKKKKKKKQKKQKKQKQKNENAYTPNCTV